ncbi:hypothetical protein C0073_017600 [Aeromonas veronii]|nr:hypothetical protein C0073_017600 [Aeromonas veronii]
MISLLSIQAIKSRDGVRKFGFTQNYCPIIGENSQRNRIFWHKKLGVSQPTINEDLRDKRIYGQSSAFAGRIRELLKEEGLPELTYLAGRLWTLEQMDDEIARLQKEGK